MDKIEVRHSGAADAEQIRHLYAEPSVYADTLQLPFPSAATWAARLGALPDGSYSLVACRGPEVLGQLGLSLETGPRRRHAAHFGMGVKGSVRREGVGSALLAAAVDMAEKWLAVRRLELLVYCDNHAAIGLYEKFGFRAEGTLRGYAFRNGTFVDARIMSRVTEHA